MSPENSFPADDDGDALRILADAGNDMSRPMMFEFHVASPSEAVAKRIAVHAAKLGYRPEIVFDDGSEDVADQQGQARQLFDSRHASENRRDPGQSPANHNCTELSASMME